MVANIASQQTRRGTISPFGPAEPAGPTVLPVQRESVSSDYFEVLGIPWCRFARRCWNVSRIDPAPVMILTYQTMTSMQTYLLEMGCRAAVVLGGLALALTVSGVFSVLSYVVEQQTKEIGVCMALGAATTNVVRLILSQSVRPVGIGLGAGVGLAATVATVLMTTPIAALGDESETSRRVALSGVDLSLLSLVCILTNPIHSATKLGPCFQLLTAQGDFTIELVRVGSR